MMRARLAKQLGRGLLLLSAAGCVLPASALDWMEGSGFRRAAVAPAGGGPKLALLAPDATGLRFTNHLSDRTLAGNQVLEIGSGAALGDVDGDGLTDVYFAAMEGGNRLYRNLGHWKFEDATAAAGVACAGQYSTGCALADLDGDGDLDLLVTGIGAGARCFRNNGKGVFQEVEAGLNRTSGSASMALADINRDGFPDLYVANYRVRTVKDSPELNVSVRQVQGQIEISPPGLFLPMRGKSGEWSLFERGEEDALYLNDGKGGFRAVDWKDGTFLGADGKPLAEAPKDWGLSVMFRDLNGDGAPDIYVCNDFFFSPDQLWLNNGQGKFRLAPPEMFRHMSMSSMAVDFADINRDGRDDFFVLDMMSRSHRTRHLQRGSLTHLKTATPVSDPLFRPEYPRNTLFLNRGDGTYAEIAQLAGLEASEWSWSASFLDADLDGYEDLLITNGNLRDANNADASGKGSLRFGKLETANLLFRNEGGLSFRETGAEWGFDLAGVSHGMALGDLDNDGDLDVVVNNMGQAAACYRNDASAGRIAVRLKGDAPNTQGIGARITLRGGAVPSQSQEVLSGGRYLSSDDGMRVFATGGASGGMTLETLWPDGRRTILENVAPNSIYEMAQSGAQPFAKPPEPAPAPLFENVSAWIRVPHQEAEFDDWTMQPLLSTALSRGGPGVGWFDADQDGWEDLLISNGRGGSQILFLNQRTGFKPLKRAEGLDRDQTTVLAWRDAAGTKLLAGLSSYEMSETNRASVVEYNLSEPGQDQTLSSAPESAGPLALGVMQGRMALFAGGSCRAGQYPRAARSRLFRRSVAGLWELDAAATKALAHVGMVSGATWADLDADGAGELILACDWGPVRVFTTKIGHLVEETAALGLDRFTGRWNALATGDFDGDGQAEIVASNWGRNTRQERHRHHPLRLYHGDWNGDGRIGLLEAYYEPSLKGYAPFTALDVIRETLPEIASRFPTFAAWGGATMEQILGEHLGKTEMLEANIFETCVFWRRDGRMEPKPLPIEAQFAPAFGIAAGDADGDGREDIFLSQNFFAVDAETSRHDGGQGLWLRGDGRGGFAALSSRESGVALIGEQRGCAVGDFDNDGRLDLAVGQNRGSFGLFRNQRAAPGLRVRLRGPASNPDGIGATVRVRFEQGWSPARTVQAGSGYWSQSSVVQVFGTPSRPVEIEARWPDGSVSRHPVLNAKEVVAVFGEGR